MNTHDDVTTEISSELFAANIATIRAGKTAPIRGEAYWFQIHRYSRYHNYCRATLHDDDAQPTYSYGRAPVAKAPEPVVKAPAGPSERELRRRRVAAAYASRSHAR